VQEVGADVDVDGSAGAVLADGDLLSGHRDGPDRGHAAGDPVIASTVNAVEGGRVPGPGIGPVGVETGSGDCHVDAGSPPFPYRASHAWVV